MLPPALWVAACPDEAHKFFDYMTKGAGIYGTGVGITGAETGLITCAGTINGHRVTGPGTFGHQGKTW